MKQILDIDVSEKKVFVRADLDVPLESVRDVHNGEREVGQDLGLEAATRLQNLKPTVDYLLDHGARQVIIAGHIDSPKSPDPALSTQRIRPALEKILSRSIIFTESFIGEIAENLVLLENLRFWPAEEANDSAFAKQLAGLGDIYINEAFGTCHREHASIVRVPELLPHAAGLHLASEVEQLSRLLEAREDLIAIVGGAKIGDKVPAILNLAKIPDTTVLVGGVLPSEIAKEGLKLPDNVIVANLTPDGLDIDADSIKRFSSEIAQAKTVVWNGPMGRFEEGHDAGTRAIAQAIVDCGAYSVVGGGNTTQFLEGLGLLDKFSFVSSGGGAMLEFLSGKELPGIKALE